MSLERSEDQSAQVTNLIGEIKALRDASEELFILLEHIWQNREDLRFKVSVVIDKEGREAIAETLCCYECGVDSPASLVQALRDGWIDITCAEEEHDANFVGWCPECQRAHEEAEQQLNQSPFHPKLAEETAPLPAHRSDDPNSPHSGNSRKANQQLNSITEESSRSERIIEPPLGADPAPIFDSHSKISSQNGETAADTSEDASTHFDWGVPSEEYRQKTPLLTRIYFQRHMTDIVRAIGYEQLSREAAVEKLKPLIERYGRETVEPSTTELLEVDSHGSAAVFRLKDQVRQLARGILGPPPASPVNEHANTAVAVAPEAEKEIESDDGPAAHGRSEMPANIAKLGTLRQVNLTRAEMVLEFREHLEKQGIKFEQIDNATRPKYTDKHIGALDFIIREAGEPPELVSVRRKVSTTQLHDLTDWKTILGDGAFVSIVWQYADDAGQTSWEVASGEVDENPPAARRDYATG